MALTTLKPGGIHSDLVTAVSGSVTAVSSSLASRLTTEEVEAEGTVVSSSAQIATDISGSITATSSSIATRFDSRETDMTLATASIAAITASISTAKTDIGTNTTNMTLATASIAAITASVSTLKSNVGQELNTDSAVTFADITSTGTITATEVHTQYVSSSITVSSGSNTFGDEIDDLHSFTGSLSVSGSGGGLFVSASGNVGIGTTRPLSQAGRIGLTISGPGGGALWLRDAPDTDSWKIEGSDSVLNIGIDTNDDGAANSQYAKIYPDGKFQLGSVLQFAEVNRTESSSVSSGTWVTMYEAPADGTFISIAWGVNSDKYSVDLWSAVDSRGTHLGPQDMGNSNGFGRRWNGNSLQTYHTSGQNRAIRSVVYRWALPSTANP